MPRLHHICLLNFGEHVVSAALATPVFPVLEKLSFQERFPPPRVSERPFFREMLHTLYRALLKRNGLREARPLRILRFGRGFELIESFNKFKRMFARLGLEVETQQAR